ncbi:hypothetical protein ASF92_01500 [Pedobacter sp. Leaf176]|nr:hypothetical protein ASF92_01500 [Pedobacter sp. Leaf176]
MSTGNHIKPNSFRIPTCKREDTSILNAYLDKLGVKGNGSASGPDYGRRNRNCRTVIDRFIGKA